MIAGHGRNASTGKVHGIAKKPASAGFFVSCENWFVKRLLFSLSKQYLELLTSRKPVMKSKKTMLIVLFLIAVCVAAALYYSGLLEERGVQAPNLKETEPLEIEPTITQPEKEEAASENTEEAALPPGVNPEFHDTPEIQVGWMARAATVIDNNLPDYATSAEVKNAFFHRGFKGWAVACGEVQFYREGELVQDYQRFVYPGVQTIYYENDVKNFQIYWDKACVQKLEQ